MALSRILNVISLAIFIALLVSMWPFIVDDTFISLRYAKHLAEGGGLVYNLGERVEGYTNLLWTLALSVAHVLPGDVVIWTKLLSAAAAIAAAWGTARLAEVSGLVPSAWRHLPASLWLVQPVVAISTSEGLETMLFAALLTWSLVATTAGRAMLAGVLLGALTLTRPDGVLVAPLVVVWLYRRHGRARAGRALMPFVAICGGVEVWRLAYYGDLLPNTFYAKQGGSLWLLAAGMRSFLVFAAVTGCGAWILALPILRQPAAKFLALVALTRLVFHLWAGGPWMGEHRFLVPMLPNALVLTVAGTLSLTTRVRGVALVCALVLLPGWIALPERLASLRRIGEGIETAYVALGMELHDTLPPAASIAIGDAGAVPYYAERTSIDVLGLNDRHIARVPGRFSYDKHDAAYVLSRSPEVIVLMAKDAEGRDWVTPADAAIASSLKFVRDYRRAEIREFLSRYFLVVYRRRPE